MSECEAHGEDIQAWLDGELEPAAAARLEAHLAACEPCRHAAEAYRRLFGALGEPAVPTAPESLAAAVLARVAAARRRRLAWQSWVTAAAVLVAAGGGLLLAWGQLPIGPLEQVGDLDLAGTWQWAWETLGGLVESQAAASGAWLAEMPGGTAALAAMLLLLGVDIFLAWRWRTLARLNSGESRAIR